MKRRRFPWGLIIFLIIIIVLVIFIVNKVKNKSESSDGSTVSEYTVQVKDILKTVSKTSYVTTGLEETINLHATYYFEEIYFEQNKYISSGENILKYTNGEYLAAPYNCVITEISVPDSEEMCTNKHYIKIQSTDTLKMSLEIDEDELDTIYIGQEAQIEIDTLSDKTITGYVTNIDNIATYSSSGSTFGFDVEFQNDGDILLGMSAKCSIILDKAENVLVVASEAITTQGRSSYVELKLEDGTTKSLEVEIGISNDAYTEIKSGLNEGDIVIVEESETESNQNGMMMQRPGESSSQGFDRDFSNGKSQGGSFEIPDMPSGR